MLPVSSSLVRNTTIGGLSRPQVAQSLHGVNHLNNPPLYVAHPRPVGRPAFNPEGIRRSGPRRENRIEVCGKEKGLCFLTRSLRKQMVSAVFLRNGPGLKSKPLQFSWIIRPQASIPCLKKEPLSIFTSRSSKISISSCFA